MSTVALDQSAEQVFSTKPVRRRNTKKVVTEESPVEDNSTVVEEAPSTGKRTGGRRTKVQVENNVTEAEPTTTAKRNAKRRPIVENTNETAPAKKTTRRTVTKEKKKEEPKTSLILKLLDDIQSLRLDPSLDVNGRKSIEKSLVSFENEYGNASILDSLHDIHNEIFASAWNTTKKKPHVLDEEVRNFLTNVDWGTAYSKANVKGKVQYTAFEEGLTDLLYSVNNGVANTVILNQLAKLYVLLNPDIKVPLPEGEKRTPQSFTIKADDLMVKYLSNIMDALAEDDEAYNRKVDESNNAKKKHKTVFDPDNIPRQQFSKIFQFEWSDYNGDDAEVLDGLKADEKLLNDTIKYYERQKSNKGKVDAEEDPVEDEEEA